MDKKDIMRGLERCGTKEHCHYGEDGCPFYFPENPDDCTSRLARQALYLLKEQDEKINELESMNVTASGNGVAIGSVRGGLVIHKQTAKEVYNIKHVDVLNV